MSAINARVIIDFFIVLILPTQGFRILSFYAPNGSAGAAKKHRRAQGEQCCGCRFRHGHWKIVALSGDGKIIGFRLGGSGRPYPSWRSSPASSRESSSCIIPRGSSQAADRCASYTLLGDEGLVLRPLEYCDDNLRSIKIDDGSGGRWVADITEPVDELIARFRDGGQCDVGIKTQSMNACLGCNRAAIERCLLQQEQRGVRLAIRRLARADRDNQNG
jgi:hypothetical protein